MSNPEQTKAIQKKAVEIYREIKRICEKNNIRFFAIGGTALGAVRHHGFIPWDDDMDLGMPLEDFEKFEKIANKELKEPFEFKKLIWIGGKVHDKNTSFIETPCLMHLENYYGVFVDIFPLIGTPNNPDERRVFLNDMFRYQYQAMTFDRYPKASKMKKPEILAWRNKLMHGYPVSDSEQLAEFSFGHAYTSNADGYKNPIEMEFEDTTIPVSSSYDEDLSKHYGDYMTLPPKSQRVAHNKFAIVDLNKPYKYYYDKFQKLDPLWLNFLSTKHELEGTFFVNSGEFAVANENLWHEYNIAKELLSAKSSAHSLKAKLSSGLRRVARSCSKKK